MLALESTSVHKTVLLDTVAAIHEDSDTHYWLSN